MSKLLFDLREAWRRDPAFCLTLFIYSAYVLALAGGCIALYGVYLLG